MPRGTRSQSTKFSASVTRVNYRENSDSTDDDGHDPGLLTNILGLLMNMQRRSAQKKKKKPSSRSRKRRTSGGCECPNCLIKTPKRTCKSRPKGKAKSQNSAASAASTSVIADSDEEEMVDAKIKDSHVDTIKNKMSTFFQALDSDEDELESKLKTKESSSSFKPVEKKNKDFYTILSDSEDEKKPSTSAENTLSFSEPSTSSLPKPSTIGLSKASSGGFSNSEESKQLSQTLNKVVEKKPEDLFAYVDDILNECNGDNVVDITSDKRKENVPVESLEDLKKKTEEILDGVTSLIEDLKPKPKEPEKTSPKKDAPTCPICLETLGSSRPAMATLCGHMFCEPCIVQVVRTSKKCPTCRKGVSKTKYHPVYI